MTPPSNHIARCTRRDFLRDASRASLVAVGAACSRADDGPLAPDDPVTEVTADVVRVFLSRAPSLAQDGGVLVVFEANIIVLRLAGPEYRAFSNVCTHAGCGIALFLANRFVCQCHGSEYDTDGINVAGPAPAPLTRLTVELDAASGVLRIARA